uniref:Uncharacterized protein n=1 Tax=Timema monikensis TaxID=170555 RepID=A0A7R9HW28_9NEOP|nr:unnamed protein product [Timema monikensis]
MMRSKRMTKNIHLVVGGGASSVSVAASSPTSSLLETSACSEETTSSYYPFGLYASIVLFTCCILTWDHCVFSLHDELTFGVSPVSNIIWPALYLSSQSKILLSQPGGTLVSVAKLCAITVITKDIPASSMESRKNKTANTT